MTTLLQVAFCGLVMAAPWYYGAVTAKPQFYLAVGLSVIGVLRFIQRLFNSDGQRPAGIPTVMIPAVGLILLGAWQLMPSGLMYRSYLAGEKEPRIANVWNKDAAGRDVMESTLGARVGLLRYGTVGAYRPQGWQFDLEGAALTRVLPGTDSTELEAVDYRVGLLSTWSEGPWHVKAGYYHLSSHLGDEFVIANPFFPRLNYVRDSLITGVTYELTDDWQTYGEIAYALGREDGADPLEFQYGLQYSPMAFGFRGAPFAALNGHTRQDFGYITSITFQAGWQWRGSESQRLFRVGMQYYDGPALQWSFAGTNETMIGGGMWFDF